MVGDKGVSFENVYTTCCKFEITTKRNIVPDIFKWRLSFSMTSYRRINEKILSNAFGLSFFKWRLKSLNLLFNEKYTNLVFLF